jgi:hypothetical protein
MQRLKDTRERKRKDNTGYKLKKDRKVGEIGTQDGLQVFSQMASAF